MKRFSWILILIGAMAGLIAFGAPVIFAGDPGSSPFDALRVNGAWQTLPANTSLWYYFDYSGDRTKIQALLEDDIYEEPLRAEESRRSAKVRMGIYTTALAYDWVRDPGVPPIGLGSKPAEGVDVGKFDLVWQGAFTISGRFYVVVTNDNALPIKFRLTVRGESVTLAPKPTATPGPTPLFNTPVAIGSVTGKFVLQEWSGGPIYTVNGDGTGLKMLTTGLDPTWSPDGKQIAFVRWTTPGGLYIMDADGSNEFLLFDPPLMISPRWSSDGKKIVFAWQKGGKEESTSCFRTTCFTTPADPFWKLGVVEIQKVISPDETKPELTEPASTFHSFSPSWSKDGRYIAFSDGGIGILHSDTLSNTYQAVFTQNPRVQSATWSPDGNRIAYQTWQHDHWEVAVMVYDGTHATALTKQNPFAFKPVNNVAPTWSPDGTQIIFLSDRNGKWEFFAINVDGTNLRQVLKSVSDRLGIQYNFSNERVIDWSR